MNTETSGNKTTYQHLCETEPSIPLFAQDWWLDAVCGPRHWDVVLIEKGGRIVASMPFMIVRQYGLTFLTMPPLTKALGPWLRASEGKTATRYSIEKDLYTRLIQSLPAFDAFCQNFQPGITNWLPFFWMGFEQTTWYTYVLNDLGDMNKIFEGFQGNIRREIKKAEQRYKLRLRRDLGIDAFAALYEMTFKRQNMRMPHASDIVPRLDAACAARKCRQIIAAEDADGRLHAAVYLVWDQHTAYYLMGGSDPALRNSGAKSLCMWEAIKTAGRVATRFDFEGSMLAPIERFFRGFGAEQTPYFRISYANKPVKWMKGIKRLLRPREKK